MRDLPCGKEGENDAGSAAWAPEKAPATSAEAPSRTFFNLSPGKYDGEEQFSFPYRPR